MKIVKYSINDYFNLVKDFHGTVAPGMVIGGFMVDYAVKNIPEGILYDSICETGNCLPDAVQLLTPCTVGNGWLKVMDLGRFALSLYNKYTGEGKRIYIDANKLTRWENTRNWFLKLKPKEQQSQDDIINELVEAGNKILGIQDIKINLDFTKRKHKKSVAICQKCKEPYPGEDGQLCKACQGLSPYI